VCVLSAFICVYVVCCLLIGEKKIITIVKDGKVSLYRCDDHFD